MPLREFKCDAGHVTEKVLFGAEDATTGLIHCPQCAEGRRLGVAKRVEWSVPGYPNLVGDGFYRPAAGNNNSKVDPAKLAKEVHHDLGGHKGVINKVVRDGK